MRPVADRDRWQEALANSHKVKTETILSRWDGTSKTLETIVQGTCTLDNNAATRGRADITIVDDGSLDLVPSSPDDDLAPYGNELIVRRGIVYPEGDEEMVNVGTLPIRSAQPVTSGSGAEIRIIAQDRSSKVIDARFESAYAVAAGTNVRTAIINVLRDAIPALEYEFVTTSRTTPALVAEEQSDRWQFAKSMATGAGLELYFDGDGVCQLQPILQPNAGNAEAFLVDGEGGSLLNADVMFDRAGVYNKVVASGENSGESVPYRGVATDNNPLSPTYYYGPFGRVPRFYVSTFINSNGAAALAAAGILAKSLGVSKKVTFSALVDPALEPGDIAQIRRLAIGIDETYALDTLSVPLAAETPLSGNTRLAQVTDAT